MTTSSSTEPHCALPIRGSRGFLRQSDRVYKQGHSSEKRSHHKPDLVHVNNDRQKSRSRIASPNNNPCHDQTKPVRLSWFAVWWFFFSQGWEADVAPAPQWTPRRPLLPCWSRIPLSIHNLANGCRTLIAIFTDVSQRIILCRGTLLRRIKVNIRSLFPHPWLAPTFIYLPTLPPIHRRSSIPKPHPLNLPSVLA